MKISMVKSWRFRPMRAAIGAVTALTLAVAFSLTSVLPASAYNATGCSPNHCYSISSSGVTNATGALITNIHANTMTPGAATGSNQWFVTSEEWLQTPDGSSWVEAGLTDGWNFSLNKPAYALFTYAFGKPYGYDSGWWYINYTSPNGATHTFQISRSASSDQFSIWADGITDPPDFMTGDVSFWSAEPVVGGEMNSNSTAAHADTFNIYHSYVNGSGAIVPWPTSGRHFSIAPGMNGLDNAAFYSWNAP